MFKGSGAITEIVDRIDMAYPNASYALVWSTPWELLVGTILAGGSTDVIANRVTAELFVTYPTITAFAALESTQLEPAIKACGFQVAKAKAIVGSAKHIVEHFGGAVPTTMAELLELPGVNRKSANVVLCCAFNVAEGIIVDTHVERLAPRIGLTAAGTVEAIERELMALVPRERWTKFGPGLILHGREVCTAKEPTCGTCALETVCMRSGLPGGAPASEKPARKKRGGAMAKESKIVDMAEVAPWTGELPALPGGWHDVLAQHVDSSWFRTLWSYVRGERAVGQVFPPEDEMFNAFAYTPFDQVKLVILGQDPYHDDGQAHGLCFSVKHGVDAPPSLKNMYKELATDIAGFVPPSHGNLEAWARQGVLLLNAVLTVRAHTPNSHKDRGWERLTDRVIDALNRSPQRIVFALWGAYAQKKGQRIDANKHIVLPSAHPSPLSAKLFLGSKPFSAIDRALLEAGHAPMQWSL